jgi:hypothetical protein
VSAARIGRTEKIDAIARLDQQARLLEGHVEGPPLDDYVEDEREASPTYDGMSVFGPARAGSNRRHPARVETGVAQLRLPGT